MMPAGWPRTSATDVARSSPPSLVVTSVPRRSRRTPRVADVKVVVVAQAVPGIGKVQARRVLQELGVAEGARWADLAPDDQRRLVESLTARGGPPAAGR